MKLFSFAVALFCSIAAHAETSFVVGGGESRWEKCGPVGCWDQPPMQADWKLKGQHVNVGIKHNDFTYSLIDFTRVGVTSGTYVEDDEYFFNVRGPTIKLKPHSKEWTGYNLQKTTGLNVAYTPTFNLSESFYLTPNVGAFIYHQTSERSFVRLGDKGKGGVQKERGEGLTISFGLAAGYRVTQSTAFEVMVQQFKCVKLDLDSPAGGQHSFKQRPGLTTFTLQLVQKF